ncbi:hypothetical protein D7X99_16185 [Corallococcus sp. AB032C]|uniref:hypothetical protein n=1 Tax=Corallococcus TaxID=83461 RepID=UPI000EEE4F2F|nr:MULTISPECIES: hypothetical protein [Corallococcus]NPC47842.1 hypothetical protein [Corallococcus exiguus]RKH82301.1 hypothetical protein D7X99_16185 [Corallococcus sp. AB032C]
MSVLDEADRKLTDNECAGARDDYRAAMQQQEPSSAALANLDVAEECEALQFRLKLGRLYPGSFSVKLNLAHALVKARGARRALGHCDELLADASRSPTERFGVRRVRMKAALASAEYMIAAEDFAYLIEAVRDQTGHRRFAVSFAAVIAGLEDWRAEAFVELLQRNLPKPNDFDALLAAKAAELKALRQFEADS